VSEALPTPELPTSGAPVAPIFAERLTAPVVRDALVLGVVPLTLAGVAGMLGATTLGYALMALTAFVAFFFRNPRREIAGDERTVVAPADGRVLEVGEISKSARSSDPTARRPCGSASSCRCSTCT
jgi:hypothetical protein